MKQYTLVRGDTRRQCKRTKGPKDAKGKAKADGPRGEVPSLCAR